MKYLISLPLFTFLMAYLGIATTATGDVEKEKLIVKTLVKTIEKNHYEPKPIDDVFSQQVFESFIKSLDNSKRFFLQSDIENFKVFYNNIDEQVKTPSFEFFDLVLQTYLQRLEDGKAIYTEILNQPFDFTQKESYETDPEKRAFPSSQAEQKDLWRKMLKYSIVSRVAQKTNEIKKAVETNDTTVDVTKTPIELETEARTKVLKDFDSWYKRLAKQNREDRFNLYAGAIVSVMDPHSSFYPPKNKEDFDIRISGKLEGIGATLQEKDGYITVVNIVPGSPSDMQGDLKVDDKILKVGQENQEPVDIVDMRLDDAVQLVRGKKGTVVKLTVKSKGGITKEIPIVRDVVVLEETYAKSAIMEKNDDRLGYIYLPRFYADFQDKTNGRQCADDIEKEIVKLKNEKVDGLVIDLRGNGGGSLSDVVKMVGFFIEEGPIVQVKDNLGQPRAYSDQDPSVLYDNPVVILVDNFSASASEIMAAALQDYDRAVVVGTNKTYGKGTVQRFFDLDQMTYGNEALKPLGSVKLTTQKFYRINGGATQLKGVVPDVILPNNYSYIDNIGEGDLDYVLPWDEVKRANYTEIGNNVKEEKLWKSSEKRTQNHEIFKLIDQNAKRLKQQEEDTQVNLNFDDFYAKICEKEEESQKFEDLEKPIQGLKISNIQADFLQMKDDTAKINRMDKWHEELLKDVYLEETFSIFDEFEH